ncbi:unnamed protein product [Lota lota]
MDDVVNGVVGRPQTSNVSTAAGARRCLPSVCSEMRGRLQARWVGRSGPHCRRPEMNSQASKSPDFDVTLTASTLIDGSHSAGDISVEREWMHRRPGID